MIVVVCGDNLWFEGEEGKEKKKGQTNGSLVIKYFKRVGLGYLARMLWLAALLKLTSMSHFSCLLNE